jgi:hypothetical protein
MIEMEFIPQCEFLFVVDTDQYAGNFEDELCAHMTGQMRESGHGEEFVDMFEQEVPKDIQAWTQDNVVHVVTDTDDVPDRSPMIILTTPGWVNDGKGGYEPGTGITGYSYLSVGIFLNEYPPDEVIQVFIERAKTFTKFKIGLQKYTTNFNITGFRILEVQASLNEKWKALLIPPKTV